MDNVSVIFVDSFILFRHSTMLIFCPKKCVRYWNRRQRSLNGRDFITVGKVKANNKILNDYRYTDDRLPWTVDGRRSSIYYRIESIDKDGRKQYSGIRSLELGTSNIEVNIFPNPASHIININANYIATINVINAIGQTVLMQQGIANASHQTINVSALSRGVYQLQLITSTKEISIKTIILE